MWGTAIGAAAIMGWLGGVMDPLAMILPTGLTGSVTAEQAGRPCGSP